MAHKMTTTSDEAEEVLNPTTIRDLLRDSRDALIDANIQNRLLLMRLTQQLARIDSIIPHD